MLTKWLKYPLTLSVILAGIILLLSPTGGTASLAAQDPYVRRVRAISTADLGVPKPAGLAFSPRATHLLTLEARSRGQRAPNHATINLISLVEEREGSVFVAESIPDPIHMTFDSKENCLLVYQADSQQLIEIQAYTNGRLDPAKKKRHAARQFRLQDPQGMTVDPVKGDLYILDGAGPRIIRIRPHPQRGFDKVKVSASDLDQLTTVDLRGIAFDPGSGHLHVLSPGEQSLYELTKNGRVVAIRDLSAFGLTNPHGMVFAPSGDLTDDPAQMSLYIADSGPNASLTQDTSYHGNDPEAVVAINQVQSHGQIVELSLTSPTAPQSTTGQGSLVQTIDTSQFSPPSPDPAGVAYLDTSNRLLISDSEVNEMPIFAGVNLFESTLPGHLTGTSSTTAFSNEPTGVTLNPTNGHLFVSDDNQDEIFEVTPGADGKYGTADDTVTSFDTRAFNSFDPEGVAFAPGLGALFIADGMNSEVYEITPGTNGSFDGIPPAGDDQVTHFDSERLGAVDIEGIAFEPAGGTLYLVGEPESIVIHVTTAGALLRVIDISAANAEKPAGLTLAPGSQDSAALNLYVADRGVDNNTDPDENDGKVYEIALPPLTPGNEPPAVDAGPAQSITLPDNATLNGTVSDDGLPDPPGAVTTTWSQVSGPAPVTFADVRAVDTSVSFFAAGTYGLRLTADDTELSASDDVTITVSGQPLPPIATLYVSSTSSGKVGGISFKDEDILAYDISTGTWSMYFDGSDVGLGASGMDIDAFHINSDGSILLSLLKPATIPDVGSIDDSDIVRFIPTSTGSNTSGSFEWYFDGSDVGLTNNGEDIDAIGLLPDGRLIISTHGSIHVSGVDGKDEDLSMFTPASLGASTSGVWALYLDGSDVGLSESRSEDIYGTWIDNNGDIYLTAKGTFAVPGVSGDEADIFTCVLDSFGENTRCTFGPFWDGSANGFSGENVDGIFLAR